MNEDEVKARLDEERERLVGLRDQVVEEEGLGEESETENLSEISSLDQHQADHGTETFNRESALSLLENVEAELADIEHALRRLDEGTYGTCEACGKAISPERLEAVPAARFCLEDQQAAEGEAQRGREREARRGG